MIYDYCTCGHASQHQHIGGVGFVGGTGPCSGYDAIGQICGCQAFTLVEEDHHRERIRCGLPVLGGGLISSR